MTPRPGKASLLHFLGVVDKRVVPMFKKEIFPSFKIAKKPHASRVIQNAMDSEIACISFSPIFAMANLHQHVHADPLGLESLSRNHPRISCPAP